MLLQNFSESFQFLTLFIEELLWFIICQLNTPDQIAAHKFVISMLKVSLNIRVYVTVSDEFLLIFSLVKRFMVRWISNRTNVNWSSVKIFRFVLVIMNCGQI